MFLPFSRVRASPVSPPISTRAVKWIREAKLPEEVRLRQLEKESRAYEEKVLGKSKARALSDVIGSGATTGELMD
ncbi:hypothetical protein SAMD00023353_3401440 [Rosellinia necatrix]|uniref:Uncharacterized protein n=1 Tax=Rosellinia necatrix TaxID=77044 RepID=A0A1S8A8Y9_ROSNE|nr:hypothetical protein SAMD00023353_3401440 [Rosellinia necatrix]